MSENSPQKQQNPWIEAAQTIGLSVVLALGIRQFVAEARFIPSESMVPTLQIDDRLVIEKISYRFNPPKRGDIIVFHAPQKALDAVEVKGKAVYIKRVIGLPGETVEVKDGKTFINGKALREDYIQAPPDYKLPAEVIPADEYLVLGDNRNSSSDGHVWGFLSKDTIIGRAAVRFWPPSRIGGLD